MIDTIHDVQQPAAMLTTDNGSSPVNKKRCQSSRIGGFTQHRELAFHGILTCSGGMISKALATPSSTDVKRQSASGCQSEVRVCGGVLRVRGIEKKKKRCGIICAVSSRRACER